MQVFDYFKGDKILYVHGFCSSGQSNTVRLLAELLPEAHIVASDLPLHPAEAMTLLRNICDTEKPKLAIGTSMGGMYGEQLYGIDRILVNPAFNMAETIRTTRGLGKQTFSNPRRDGIQEFMLTKSLLKEYADVTEQCFLGVNEAEQSRVYGLFGSRDPIVHTRELFSSHYRNVIVFDGEHRLNDHVLLHSVMPVVGWIYNKQQNIQHPILYIHIDALVERNNQPASDARNAVEHLSQLYDTYIVATQDDRPQQWLAENIGVPVYNRLIMTNHESLLYGDYLIKRGEPDNDNFVGTFLQFGSDKFKNWEQMLEYFELLGGQ